MSARARERFDLSNETATAPAVTPAAQRVQKPQRKTLERREAVLKAALSVFGARGYNNGALAEIAAQAGMTHAGVLHHFGSKEALLIAVLQYRDGEEVAGIARREQPTGKAFLGHLLDTVRENTTRPGVVQAYAVLSAESVTDGHPAQEYFRGRLTGLREKLVGVINEATDFVADQQEVHETASALIAVMDGLQVQWLLDPAAVDMPRTVELVLEELVGRLMAGRRDIVVPIGPSSDATP